MSHRYQKGSKCPDPHVKRDRGKAGRSYELHGGIPWPELGDGTPWSDSITRVRHAELTQEVGKLQWVEWCQPDGSFMADAARLTKETKTKPATAKPGVWMAVVSWDRRDRHDSLLARHVLTNLLPE